MSEDDFVAAMKQQATDEFFDGVVSPIEIEAHVRVVEALANRAALTYTLLGLGARALNTPSTPDTTKAEIVFLLGIAGREFDITQEMLSHVHAKAGEILIGG